MKKWVSLIAVVVCSYFYCLGLVNAEENKVFTQLKNELAKDAMFAPKELDAINKPLLNMLEKGATKDDLRRLVRTLAQNNFRGDELKKTFVDMNELVNNGESPKEAGNIVSQAAHAAHAQGLKGKDLAAKVHEAIRLRKSTREELKKREKEQLKQHLQETKQEHKEKKEQHRERSMERHQEDTNYGFIYSHQQDKGKGKK